MLDKQKMISLERARDYARENLPEGFEDTLAERYDGHVPKMSESLIEWAYGRHYSRDGLDMKSRQLCTIAALTAMGGQTAPQLKANIHHTLMAGATKREIFEAIWQMSVYAGMPAAINGLNAAIEVFDKNEGM